MALAHGRVHYQSAVQYLVDDLDGTAVDGDDGRARAVQRDRADGDRVSEPRR